LRQQAKLKGKKKRRADEFPHLRDAYRTTRRKFLANAGAIKTPVAVHTHLSTAEQIRHRGNGLFGVFGAGTHGENEIAERKLGVLLEDLRVLFHGS
jgi:hypothetical protein